MRRKLLALILAAAAVWGCREDGGEYPGPSAKQITITPVITRATEADFEPGDRIGLTVARSAGTVFAQNHAMSFDGNAFAGDLAWYTDETDASLLTAYYPYSSAGFPETFTVAANQSSTGYGASDLMASRKDGVTPSVNPVTMEFKRLLSGFEVSMTNESGLDVVSVTLRGSVATASVDPQTFAVEADQTVSPTDIVAQQVTHNERYRAIVVPQTVAFTLEVRLSDRTLAKQLPSIVMAQGGLYGVDVRVLSDRLVVDGQSDVPFEEFDGYFIYDGNRYETVTLANGTTWMASPLRYLPEGFTLSADPLADSHIWYPYALEDDNNHDGVAADRAVALTDEASIVKNGYLYDLYAALGGVEITVDNCYDYEGTQGICPAGWHIPTRMEFVALCGLSNKAVGETGNLVDATALFYDSGYGGGKRTLFEAGGWNYVLSGVRMQNNFSSTPAYQLTQLWSGNTSLPADMYGTPSLTYIMSSTCYQPAYSSTDPGLLTNIQFFSQMTTFTSLCPEGKVNVAYISIRSGQQVRCVKN